MWPPWAGVNCITKLFFCRNKVLTTEVKALKQQMATVLEKGRHDDELIAALMVLITMTTMDERHRDQLRKVEKERRDAQEVWFRKK